MPLQKGKMGGKVFAMAVKWTIVLSSSVLQRKIEDV